MNEHLFKGAKKNSKKIKIYNLSTNTLHLNSITPWLFMAYNTWWQLIFIKKKWENTYPYKTANTNTNHVCLKAGQTILYWHTNTQTYIV